MERSINTSDMNHQEALEHLKSVVEKATKDAQSVSPRYTSKLLVCFCWKEDDVNASVDCDDISEVFKECYNAHVVRLVLEMKEYKPMDVLILARPILNMVKDSQLVVLFYRYTRLT